MNVTLMDSGITTALLLLQIKGNSLEGLLYAVDPDLVFLAKQVVLSHPKTITNFLVYLAATTVNKYHHFD